MKLEQHKTLKNLLKTLTDCVELKHSSFRLSLAPFSVTVSSFSSLSIAHCRNVRALGRVSYID